MIQTFQLRSYFLKWPSGSPIKTVNCYASWRCAPLTPSISTVDIDVNPELY